MCSFYPRRRLSSELYYAGTLISTFQSLELWEMFLLLISSPGYDTTHYIIPSIWYPIYGTFLMFTTGEGNGSPLQYSCLENPVDRRAWWAAVHSVTQSQTRHDWSDLACMHALEKEWQPTPVVLPGEFQGQRSLMGCHLWGRTGSDTTEATKPQQQQQQHKYLKCKQYKHID